LFNGDYYRYLQSLSPEVLLWFDEHEDVRRTDWEVKPVTGGSDFNLLIFNTPSSPPHFEEIGSTPFHREVTFGYTTVGDILYILYPVFYLHEGDVYPVIYTARIYDEARIDRINQTYLEQNQTTTVTGPDYWGRDPLVSQTWEKYGVVAMEEKMERFMNEDLSALDGLILLTEIARTDSLK